MSELIQSIVIGVVLVAMHITAVLLLVKKVIPNTLSPVISHVLSAIVMLIVLMFLAAGMADLVWLTFSIFAFGVAAYLFVFGAVYKSLSLRFLLQIQSTDGQSSLATLDYVVTQQSFSNRAALLCEMGLAVRHHNGYQVTAKGKSYANKIYFLRKLFGIRARGLY